MGRTWVSSDLGKPLWAPGLSGWPGVDSNMPPLVAVLRIGCGGPRRGCLAPWEGGNEPSILVLFCRWRQQDLLMDWLGVGVGEELPGNLKFNLLSRGRWDSSRSCGGQC